MIAMNMPLISLCITMNHKEVINHVMKTIINHIINIHFIEFRILRYSLGVPSNSNVLSTKLNFLIHNCSF